MNVRVVLSVKVDPQAVRDEYGDQSLTADDVREMVRGSTADAVRTAGVVFPEGIVEDVELKETK